MWVENEDKHLRRKQICRRVEGGYDLHMRLVDSSSVLAHLTLKRVLVNLLNQQEHLVFLLARTRKLEVMSKDPKTRAGENAFPDLERQLFEWTPTIVDDGDPMWKLKLVKEERAAVKNICPSAQKYDLKEEISHSVFVVETVAWVGPAGQARAFPVGLRVGRSVPRC